MNLQIDLILPEEQRSASAFNLQAFLRIMSIVGPSIILLIFFMFYIHVTIIKNELNSLEIQWESIKSKKNRADKLRNQIIRNKEIYSDLEGIKKSRLEWYEQLINYMQATPDNIQFKNFSANQSLILEDKKVPARSYKATISGKAIGNNVDTSVAEFKQTLVISPTFKPFIERAEVTKYQVDDSPGASKNDRVFQINCSYIPRIIK